MLTCCGANVSGGVVVDVLHNYNVYVFLCIINLLCGSAFT